MYSLVKRFFLVCLFLGSIALAQNGAPAAGGTSAPATSGTVVHTPLVLGGVLGFGSGTGVGADRGLGLYQVDPIIGLWYPNLGFLRVGYGFYDFTSRDEDASYKVEHSNFDVELGIHLLGEIYLTGSYSRVGELSDIGDVAWNEWGVGGGSMLNLFSKTILFAEVGYRWVLTHYDPFQDKSIHGGRIQMNIGFVAYVY